MMWSPEKTACNVTNSSSFCLTIRKGLTITNSSVEGVTVPEQVKALDFELGAVTPVMKPSATRSAIEAPKLENATESKDKPTDMTLRVLTKSSDPLAYFRDQEIVDICKPHGRKIAREDKSSSKKANGIKGETLSSGRMPPPIPTEIPIPLQADLSEINEPRVICTTPTLPPNAGKSKRGSKLRRLLKPWKKHKPSPTSPPSTPAKDQPSSYHRGPLVTIEETIKACGRIKPPAPPVTIAKNIQAARNSEFVRCVPWEDVEPPADNNANNSRYTGTANGQNLSKSKPLEERYEEVLVEKAVLAARDPSLRSVSDGSKQSGSPTSTETNVTTPASQASKAQIVSKDGDRSDMVAQASSHKSPNVPETDFQPNEETIVRRAAHQDDRAKIKAGRQALAETRKRLPVQGSGHEKVARGSIHRSSPSPSSTHTVPEKTVVADPSSHLHLSSQINTTNHLSAAQIDQIAADAERDMRNQPNVNDQIVVSSENSKQQLQRRAIKGLVKIAQEKSGLSSAKDIDILTLLKFVHAGQRLTLVVSPQCEVITPQPKKLQDKPEPALSDQAELPPNNGLLKSDRDLLKEQEALVQYLLGQIQVMNEESEKQKAFQEDEHAETVAKLLRTLDDRDETITHLAEWDDLLRADLHTTHLSLSRILKSLDPKEQNESRILGYNGPFPKTLDRSAEEMQLRLRCDKLTKELRAVYGKLAHYEASIEPENLRQLKDGYEPSERWDRESITVMMMREQRDKAEKERDQAREEVKALKRKYEGGSSLREGGEVKEHVTAPAVENARGAGKEMENESLQSHEQNYAHVSAPSSLEPKTEDDQAHERPTIPDVPHCGVSEAQAATADPATQSASLAIETPTSTIPQLSQQAPPPTTPHSDAQVPSSSSPSSVTTRPSLSAATTTSSSPHSETPRPHPYEALTLRQIRARQRAPNPYFRAANAATGTTVRDFAYTDTLPRHEGSEAVCPPVRLIHFQDWRVEMRRRGLVAGPRQV